MTNHSLIAIMATVLSESSLCHVNRNLPLANCNQCKYMYLPKDGGWCYMFKKSPGTRCGQMKLFTAKARVGISKIYETHRKL